MKRRTQRFSRRHGLVGRHKGLLVFDDAPKRLRVGFLGLLEGDLGLSPDTMRAVVCRQLREEPNPNNWSPYPNVWDEVQKLVFNCEWYEFFDIVEAFAHIQNGKHVGKSYEDTVNQLLEEEGIGWVLDNGELELRGEEPLDKVLQQAFSDLEESNLDVAHGELGEAWAALSRRPSPNVSGAVMHAMAALESVAREWSGDAKLTLGEIIKKHGAAFPRPLDDALNKIWGFASEQARHGRENRNLELNDAFLVVGVAATLCTYVISKLPSNLEE